MGVAIPVSIDLKFKKGEFIFYISQNGDHSMYMVNKIITQVPEQEIELISVLPNGDVDPKRGKRFTSTLTDKKGRRRLYPIWLQPGDRVKIKGQVGDAIGKVEGFLVENSQSGTYKNMVEIITDKSKQHMFTFEQAITILDFI